MFEIALPLKDDVFRVIYALQFADGIWVVHASENNSRQGIKTPRLGLIVREGN